MIYLLIVNYAGRMLRQELRFEAISFFPNIPIYKIWEVEFKLNINFNSFGNYNDLEYFEFVWHYERLKEYLNAQESSSSLSNYNAMLNGGNFAKGS